MTFPDTEVAVREMCAALTDWPEVATVSQLDDGGWLVILADGAQATVFPLEGRVDFDPLNEQRRAHALGFATESDCFGDLD